MPSPQAPCVYQFKVVLRGISPMIWRRLLLRSDHSIADLHYAIQIAMGWSDAHLNRFHIHGKQRPCPHCGRARGLKSSHQVRFQTLFGNLELRSPRWNHCGCQPKPAKTFSPLSTLPVAETVNAAGVRNHLHRVAERAEAALGDERVSFIEGCPREWAALPHPQINGRRRTKSLLRVCQDV
jgi:hypothetical protein